jgi:membrane dipeptidase
VRALAEKGAVIGVALDAWMLYPDWKRGVTTPETAGVTLKTVAEHVDHFCQVLGSTRHVGIGSDLDGCFGTEQTPADLDSIADLQKLRPLLAHRGFSEADQEAVCHGNFVRHLTESLPA